MIEEIYKGRRMFKIIAIEEPITAFRKRAMESVRIFVSTCMVLAERGSETSILFSFAPNLKTQPQTPKITKKIFRRGGWVVRGVEAKVEVLTKILVFRVPVIIVRVSNLNR